MDESEYRSDIDDLLNYVHRNRKLNITTEGKISDFICVIKNQNNMCDVTRDLHPLPFCKLPHFLRLLPPVERDRGVNPGGLVVATPRFWAGGRGEGRRGVVWGVV